MNDRSQATGSALALSSAPSPPLAAQAARRSATAPLPSRSQTTSAVLWKATRTLAPATVLPAVAAGSFAAGAAVFGIMARRRSPLPARRPASGKLGSANSVSPSARRRGPLTGRLRRGNGAEVWQVVASRSILVDVHLLDRQQP